MSNQKKGKLIVEIAVSKAQTVYLFSIPKYTTSNSNHSTTT